MAGVGEGLQACLHPPRPQRASTEDVIPATFFMVLYKNHLMAAIKTICVNIIFMAEWYFGIWLGRHQLNYLSIVFHYNEKGDNISLGAKGASPPGGRNKKTVSYTRGRWKDSL